MNLLLIILLCVIYAVFNVSGSALIKSEIPQHNLNTIGGFVSLLLTWKAILGFFIIVFSALVIFKALSLGRFSYVIPISTGINFSLTVMLGVLCFKDRVSGYSLSGFSLIILGIFLMSMGQSK